jgi:hypothetical protein
LFRITKSVKPASTDFRKRDFITLRSCSNVLKNTVYEERGGEGISFLFVAADDALSLARFQPIDASL